MKTKAELIQELYSTYSRVICPKWLAETLAKINAAA